MGSGINFIGFVPCEKMESQKNKSLVEQRKPKGLKTTVKID